MGHEDWPVDPEHLWEHGFDDPETDDALWEYESHHSNNDEEIQGTALMISTVMIRMDS